MKINSYNFNEIPIVLLKQQQ